MKNLPEVVKSYLNKHATDKWKLNWKHKPGIENVIVIPALAEFENLNKLLSSISKNNSSLLKKTLIIFVVNNLIISSSETKENNQLSIKFLKKFLGENNIDKKIIAYINHKQLQIGIIDASSPGVELPKKTAGVGLARKIGMDAALTVFDYSQQTKKLIISLDADCTVEPDYLSTITAYFEKTHGSAATIEYEHDISCNDDQTKAIVCYEIYLRYYVIGLRFAKSKFAFHSIGSTMAFSHKAYIQSGGMNKRKAGEDYYFLQKLAKNFDVHKINSTTVQPAARSSLRTPFGTGRSVNRYIGNSDESYQLYNPKIFELLKRWLILFNSGKTMNITELLVESKNINKQLYRFLELHNFKEQWKKILENCKTEEQLSYQKINWFDGFKTLKLIHYLRDTKFPMMDMFDSVDKLLNMMGIVIGIERGELKIPDLKTQKEYLIKLRQVEKSLSEKH
jgi:hypothetical protein